MAQDSFTEDPPAVVGWYWRKTSTRTAMVYVSQVPCEHWTIHRDRCLTPGSGVGSELLPRLQQLPESEWVVKWAGPLVPPQD